MEKINSNETKIKLNPITSMILESVPISSITIPSRAREVDIESRSFKQLVESIKNRGLLTPITIRKKRKLSDECTDDHIDEYFLVCGARRLTAHIQLNFETIPSIVRSALVLVPTEEIENLIAELEENLVRLDFTWQERIIAKGILFYKLKKQSGTTQKQFSAMFNISQGMTSLELDLYDGSFLYPSILNKNQKKITSANEELRRLKIAELVKEKLERLEKKREKERNKNENSDINNTNENGDTINSQSTQLYGDRENNQNLSPLWNKNNQNLTLYDPDSPNNPNPRSIPLISTSAHNLLSNLPDNSIDCIVTDPPFGINIETMRKGHAGKPDVYKECGEVEQSREQENQSYSDSEENYISTVLNLFPEFSRVLKPGSHLYLFYDTAKYQLIIDKLIESGFLPNKIPLIWIKSLTSYGCTTNQPKYLPASSYQSVIMAFAPGTRRILSKQGLINTLSYPLINPKLKTHPMEIPVEVYFDLMSRSTYPGDVIIDPFCGTGNSLLAAKRLGCSILGAEIREDYRNLAELKFRETVRVTNQGE